VEIAGDFFSITIRVGWGGFCCPDVEIRGLAGSGVGYRSFGSVVILPDVTSAIVDGSSGSDVNVRFPGVTPPYVSGELGFGWVNWSGAEGQAGSG